MFCKVMLISLELKTLDKAYQFINYTVIQGFQFILFRLQSLFLLDNFYIGVLLNFKCTKLEQQHLYVLDKNATNVVVIMEAKFHMQVVYLISHNKKRDIKTEPIN